MPRHRWSLLSPAIFVAAIVCHASCAAQDFERLPPVQQTAVDRAYFQAAPQSVFSETSAASSASSATPVELASCGLSESDWLPTCDDCPTHSLNALVAYDTWRGVADGGWQNNGLNAGLNCGTRLGAFSDVTGVGFQIGGTAGVYDWAGTDYRLQHQDQAQTQGFITYGFFRKANENSPWSAGIVQDWMLNNNYSVFAQNPTLGQWRGQVGYATSATNEFGVWGTWRMHGDSRQVPGFGSVSWRAVNTLSTFWHHKWSPGGADSSVWLGVPEHKRLAGGGSLGDYLAGASAQVPLSDRVALYTLVTYMHPSARPGDPGSNEDAWNFTVGLALYPARNARTRTVAGQCWAPLMPVANNGYFLADASQNY